MKPRPARIFTAATVLLFATLSSAHEGYIVAPPSIHSGNVYFGAGQQQYARPQQQQPVYMAPQQIQQPAYQVARYAPRLHYQPVRAYAPHPQRLHYSRPYRQPLPVQNPLVAAPQLEVNAAQVQLPAAYQQPQQLQVAPQQAPVQYMQQQLPQAPVYQPQPQQYAPQQYSQPQQQQVQQLQYAPQPAPFPQQSYAVAQPQYGQPQVQQQAVFQQPQQQQYYQPPQQLPVQQYAPQPQQYAQPQQPFYDARLSQQVQQVPQVQHVQQVQQVQQQLPAPPPPQLLPQSPSPYVAAPPPPVATAIAAPQPQPVQRGPPPPPDRFGPHTADLYAPEKAVAATGRPHTVAPLTHLKSEDSNAVILETSTYLQETDDHRKGELLKIPTVRPRKLKQKKVRVKVSRPATVIHTRPTTPPALQPPPRKPISAQHRIITTPAPSFPVPAPQPTVVVQRPRLPPPPPRPNPAIARPASPPMAPPPPPPRPAPVSHLASHKASTLAALSREDTEKDPNALFLQCCKESSVNPKCESRCNFDTLTKKVLTGMFLGTDPCPQKNGRTMLECAAQRQDHTQCCLERGVHTTAAKNKCLGFCVMTPGSDFQADISMLPCWAVLNDIKGCFKDAILNE